MGFAQGMAAMAASRNATTNRKAEDRAKRQQEITMLTQNMEVADDGSIQYNQQGQLQQDMKYQELEQRNQALQAQQQAFQSKMNADSIAKMTDYWTQGDFEDAFKMVNQTPGLKESLQKAQSFNFQDFNTVDFRNSATLRQFEQFGVDPEKLKDPEVQDALARSFMTIRGQDGKDRLASIDEIIKQTNSMEFYDKQMRDRHAKNLQYRNGILQGLRPQDIDTKNLQTDLAATGAQAQLDELTQFLEAGGTYSDYLGMQKAKQTPVTADMQLKQMELSKAKRDEAISSYTNQNRSQVYDSIKGGNIDTKLSIAGGEIPLVTVAQSLQGDAKLSSTRQDYLEGMERTLKNTSRLYTKLQSSDFDWDAFTKVMDDASKLTGTDWRKMSQADKDQMLERFSFDSDLRTVMAGYIKAMSGAAVSDEERKFYENAILGGNWSTKEAALASMEGFNTGLYNGYKSSLENMVTSTPKDYLDYKWRFDNIQIPDYTKAPTKASNPITSISNSVKSEPSNPKVDPALEAEMRRRGLIK